MAPPSDRPGVAGRLLSAVRHAFAVEGESAGLSPEQLETADRVAAALARRGLAIPAVMLLETLRPLNYVAAQALHGLTPLVGSLVGDDRVRGLAEFLEARGSIDAVCQRLEAAGSFRAVREDQKSTSSAPPVN